MEQPQISIICNTYNQEKYIGQALDSFLMQKVSVPFEILVHDDASTDGTSHIIKKYEELYPDIVKPIYNPVNQYSLGNSITANIQIPRAKGKYLAFCEGDDYWSEQNKLQIQYDYMEKHPEATGCCHAYSMVKRDNSLIEEIYDFLGDCEVPMSRLIGNQLKVPHFATLFLRKGCIENMGDQFLGRPCNDMVIRIYCAVNGSLHYISKNMSCYRRNVEGSWTCTIGQNKAKLKENLLQYIPFLYSLDEYTGNTYHELIMKSIDEREFNIALLENDYRAAIKKQAYLNASIKRKVYIALGCIVPKLISQMRESEMFQK